MCTPTSPPLTPNDFNFTLLDGSFMINNTYNKTKVIYDGYGNPAIVGEWNFPYMYMTTDYYVLIFEEGSDIPVDPYLFKNFHTCGPAREGTGKCFIYFKEKNPFDLTVGSCATDAADLVPYDVKHDVGGGIDPFEI